MCAIGERLVLQSAPIPRSHQFGTPVRLRRGLFVPIAPKVKPVTRQARYFAVRAEDKIREKLDGALRSGNKLADSAADLLPESVPRGAAKIGVVGVGGLVAFWLLQKVLSTFVFLGVLGGGAYLWLKLSSNDDSDGGDSGDALTDAKRIMDKYR
ncbi:hypothetical protein COCSUDRAFT_52800 [Coccomyxa subellipsoidea C-169]|uniref:Uncharacterized protein n=1 Tax=Coccomyxa subellipsoidea (strain C-169) TaxID=574566 RepID=I0Z3L1_COCSC|nr:hypothetical protein COCSUDRAFT_52800 [Coccomyxa subellipsoidea C-169]EIE25230.1 hypothetical protein COCSUDRAFT_52800 [Coccomyxa subellipsoidea C-169]|eukprot:XP_005649774.1 hypothetical protein COCSUDRAFT_52800 [Coccomyxa subellipsoidea C-169]